MEWKWTKGEPYERSRRLFKEQTDKDTETFNKEIENSAYSSALNHDENTWDILNQSLSGNGFKVSNKREEIDTYDDYITQKVKLAQLSFTYLEHQKKMEEVKGIIINTRELIKKLDDEFPDYKTSYYEKYMQARRDAGIKETSDDLNANFLKFLVQDAELGF